MSTLFERLDHRLSAYLFFYILLNRKQGARMNNRLNLCRVINDFITVVVVVVSVVEK